MFSHHHSRIGYLNGLRDSVPGPARRPSLRDDVRAYFRSASTICESAIGAVREFPYAWGRGALEFGHVCVATVNLHMHRDGAVNSLGDDELTSGALAS